VWYYKDNEERLLEMDSPSRSQDTASLSGELLMSKVSLVADGWKNKDTRVVLWAIGGEGGYSYELEEGCRTSLMNCSYEYAIEKVKRLCATTGAVCVY